MDFFDSMKDSIVRAGREAARVRFVGEAQARLVGLRLTRRVHRDALVDEVLALYRRHALHHPDLVRLCRAVDDLDGEIDRIDHALARARGRADQRPIRPVVTELSRRQHQDA